MNGNPEDPRVTGLLDRVTQLETHNTELIARIVELEKQAADSHSYFMRLAKQVNGVLHSIGLIDLQVVELAERVFPGYVRTQQQINAILAPPEKPEE